MLKPRFGILFENMRKSKSYFKYVFQKCRIDNNMKSAGLLANKLLGKCDKMFWKEIKKINNGKIAVSNLVNNGSGKKNISTCGRITSRGF